ncbi:mitochondrial acylphosphatase [Andalucia godoyi]|uniref:acylphosphatase n=1 Tax=Andalucia godoyi TaxID=505711 RepID=A0A8K0F2T6_ANDGO|nr:mitochondrial acylphosphatase [Andalucia godoyi]|eukprot:ANDGO_08483.mRNA.1 mitochondrial acylphosphatase
MAIVQIHFQVFGKVQRVFFRKYTHAQAEKLRLSGWVRNDPDGTVVGVAEGSAENIAAMKQWLSTVGSPKSKIERAVFTNEQQVAARQFAKFEIDRSTSD